MEIVFTKTFKQVVASLFVTTIFVAACFHLELAYTHAIIELHKDETGFSFMPLVLGLLVSSLLIAIVTFVLLLVFTVLASFSVKSYRSAVFQTGIIFLINAFVALIISLGQAYGL